MSQAYVLLAHGSRRAQSNQEVQQLAARLSEQLAAPVAAAFIEQCQPDLVSTCASLLASGASQIRVLPYLLAAGRHLAEDIPALLADCRQRWPQLAISCSDHVGGAPLMLTLLADLASHSHDGHKTETGERDVRIAR